MRVTVAELSGQAPFAVYHLVIQFQSCVCVTAFAVSGVCGLRTGVPKLGRRRVSGVVRQARPSRSPSPSLLSLSNQWGFCGLVKYPPLSLRSLHPSRASFMQAAISSFAEAGSALGAALAEPKMKNMS